MNRRSHLSPLLLATTLLGWPGSDTLAQVETVSIRADFSQGWAERWEEVRLAARSNRIIVVEDGGASVLKVVSERSASALWHPIDVAPGDGARVSWAWKVERPLMKNEREREKRGDDYAARLFVIFNAEPFSREARAVCYVWSSSEPAGSVYRNPYFPNVVTIVVRSGTERIGRWVREERDFLQDYRDAFGEDPAAVTAVAVMVDTDNTKGSAQSWFDSIELQMQDPNVDGGPQPANRR
jgi:hypothetical protein